MGSGAWPGQYRLRAIDATDIQEPGSTGTDWRTHHSNRLPELSCDHYELTDVEVGEKPGHFHFNKDELILADRGYSHRGRLGQSFGPWRRLVDALASPNRSGQSGGRLLICTVGKPAPPAQTRGA